VNAGTHDFKLLAEYNGSGSGSIYERQLSLVFIPSAYGTINPVRTGIASGGPGPARVSAATDRAALSRELDRMRHRIDAIQAELDAGGG